MSKFLPHALLLAVAISLALALALAVIYWQHETPAATVSVAMPPSAAPSIPAVQSAAQSPTPTQEATPAAQLTSVDLHSTAVTAERDDDAHADDEAAQQVPVNFHIRHRRDQDKIEGEVHNPTAKTLSITLRAVSATTQATSVLNFQLAPGETRPYSSEQGLYMQTGDELTVQSPPYQDKVVRVP